MTRLEEYKAKIRALNLIIKYENGKPNKIRGVINMKVENMTSNRGNQIANQFIIYDGLRKTFQSYNSTICEVSQGKIWLDETYWNYSKTTSKYRNIFLNETTKETQKKLDSGEYILSNLN